MERRLGLAIVALGALSMAALAQSQSVVTLPLNPPVKKEAEEQKAEPAKTPPKPAEQTAAIAPKPDAPVAPQALFRLPAPAFTTEPIFPPSLTIDPDSLPRPEIDRALLEAKQKSAAKTPMPQPKPPVPALSVAASSSAPVEPRQRRGVMEPIDDYRPPRSSVVVDPSALERTLTPTNAKPASIPLPRAKPDAPALQESAVAEGGRPLRRGVMEPIDDYRPQKRTPAAATPPEASLVTAEEEPVDAPAEPKPAPPQPGAGKKASPHSGIMSAGDAPAGKMFTAKQGKATTFRCFVRDVTAHYDRTHVRCYNKAKGKLYFFAVDTSQPISATVVSKGLAAMQTGQPATIAFAPEAELNPANCAPANCRRLIDIQN